MTSLAIRTSLAFSLDGDGWRGRGDDPALACPLGILDWELRWVIDWIGYEAEEP